MPDYIANAGGVISGSDHEPAGGRDAPHGRRHLRHVREKVLALADERACTPLEAAERLAEEKLGERRLM